MNRNIIEPSYVHDTLPDELWLLVMEFLCSPKELCKCREVCRGWLRIIDGESVWSTLIKKYCVNINEERKAIANTKRRINDVVGPCCEGKLLFVSWYMRYNGFTESYARIRRAMLSLERWAEIHSPPVLFSLSSGLGWMGDEKMPVREFLSVVHDSPNMRDFLIAYHLHDGQRRVEQYLSYGLFGTYGYYDELCSLSWLPSRMVQAVQMGVFRILVFAWCSSSHNYLGVVIDCPEAHADTLMHHVVQLQPRSYRFVDKGLFGDFFVTYVDDLVSGLYDTRGGQISMMPSGGPHTGQSIYCGIKTTISVLFCPNETYRIHVYKYKVSFEVVDSDALGYPSAQLKSRFWLMHFMDGQYVQTHGEGVAGAYPTLSEERNYYSYCSRVQDEADMGLLTAFEGHFVMVPGSLDDPLGPEFLLPAPYVEVPIPSEII